MALKNPHKGDSMLVKRLVPILTVLALILCEQAFAAPAINNIGGKFTDGNSITISGSGFGVNGPTTVIFDNFDKGANGSVIKTGPGSATVGKWDDIGGGDDNNPPVYSNSYRVSGSLALRGDYRVKTSSGTDSSSNANVQNLKFTEAFLSYWFFLPTTSEFPGSSDDNWKLGWFVYTPGGDEDLLVFEMLGASGEKDMGCNNCYVYRDWPNRSNHVVLRPDFTFRKGTWYRVHMYIKGTYDYTGKRQLWTLSPDASMAVTQRVNWTGRQWNENGNYWNKFIINPWARLCNGCSESYGVFDDVYLAIGSYARARVEIGNASSYSSCNNLSICTVDSWSNTSIQVTLRQGSFGPGDAYFYITDANGITSNGYQIAIGGESISDKNYVSKDGSDSNPGTSATDGDEYNEPPIEEGVVEAEIGLLTAPMTKVFDDACSGGAYIHSPSGGSGRVVYTVNVEPGGIYKIVARVFSIDEGHDSFFVQIDGQEENIWDLNPSDSPSEHNVWREDEVTKRGSGTYSKPEFDPYTSNLMRGAHTISFRARESNAKLDYFRLEEISGIVPPKVPAEFTITGE
jgi:hypothetical protein